MLRRFQVKNFRSCKNVVLEGLGSLTALVGRNGSGKTNVLRAIAWLGEVATSTEIPLLSHTLLVGQGLSAELEMDLGDAHYRYTFAGRHTPAPGVNGGYTFTLCETLAAGESSEGWEIILERRGSQVRVTGRSDMVALGITAPSLSALSALLPQEDSLQRHLRPVLAFLRGLRYYPFDEPSEVAGDDRFALIAAYLYEQWAARYQATGQTGDSVPMRLIHAHLERPMEFNEIEELLGPKGLDLIQKITVSRVHPVDTSEEVGTGTPSYFRVRFRLGRILGGGSEQRSYGNLSLGTRRVLDLIVSLILDRSSLMLVEHPEDGIHRGLVRKLIDLLRTNADPVQIILSSHSGVVLNALAPKDVRLVTIRRGATEVRPLTLKEVTAAERYIDEEGTLGEFLESVTE